MKLYNKYQKDSYNKLILSTLLLMVITNLLLGYAQEN